MNMIKELLCLLEEAAETDEGTHELLLSTREKFPDSANEFVDKCYKGWLGNLDKFLHAEFGNATVTGACAVLFFFKITESKNPPLDGFLEQLINSCSLEFILEEEKKMKHNFLEYIRPSFAVFQKYSPQFQLYFSKRKHLENGALIMIRFLMNACEANNRRQRGVSLSR